MLKFEHNTRPENLSENYWQQLRRRNRQRRLIGAWVLLFMLALAVYGVINWLHEPAVAIAGDNLPFRLHILANSDNAADQTLKLQVRDAVVAYLTPLLADVETAEEARAVVMENIPQLEALAAGITADFGYGAYAEVGHFDFPAKRYGQVYMPAGEYPALRLVLGEGVGHNWWCVLYPPLCFVDECGEFQICGEGENAGLLVSQQGERQVRLKICEIFYDK